MILAFLRFELREQLRSPLLGLLAALYALLAFAALSSDAVQIGGGIGNVLRNAPTVIATLLGLFSLLGLLVITLFVSNAVLRDFDLGTAELVFSTPIRRRDYLLGRIGAALIAGMLMYVVIALGMFAAQFMPWLDQARLGPVAVLPYLWSLLVLVLPNLLFTTALLSVLAVTTRSILWVYIGVIVFFVLYGVSRALMADLDNVWIATLADPLGIRALSQTLRYWSVEQRNHQLPPLTGYLLANRAVWLGMSGVLFAATFALFRTERSGTRRRRGVASVTPADAPPSSARVSTTRLTVTPRFGAATAWRQLLRQIRFDTLGVLRSAPFVVLLMLGLANFIPTALFKARYYGTAVLPVTSLMLEALQNSYSFLLIIVVLFYAGELVWKERSNRIDGITDAMPVPDWVPLLGKFVALLAVIASFQAAGALTSVALQLGRGYTSIEPLLYLKTLALGSVLYVLMGGMALALQVLSNNKFVGYALLMLVLIGQSALSMLDYTQNLYTFGGWPNAPYSDMNGYGHFLPGQLWFQGYWGVFLLALLLLSSAFWPRGVGHDLRQRVRLALRRLRSPTGAALAITLLGFAAIGGWLYWNTNVYNSFLSPEQQLDLQARYERDYRKYKDLPQPRIVAVDNHVDLHPETQSVVVDATWTVRNTHPTPISEVHIGMQGRTGDRSLVEVDLGGQTLSTHDIPAGYRIYRLQTPLQPGQERVFHFRVDQHPHGLTAEQAQTELVANGSFFNTTLLPWFGYNTQTEISDRNERRKRGLGEPTRMPKLEDQAARANTYVSTDADWLAFASTVCTAPHQIALAPGYLQQEFQRNGRRCFRYVMDRPMLNFYAYLSARWEVRKARYKNIPIEIYYDPKHPYNVQRMIESVQKSLAYYQANFSPYQHHQVRIIEFPGYARFAQSFANTIPYSESIGFIADLRDKNDIDYVFYVTAHEVAHQWWAHQVIGANVQGATLLSESLAQYSALMVMEREYGRAHMRRFLRYELDRYLEGRGDETIEELPLYRVEDQQYIHYRKGSLAFYRLREDIGEQALNRALQRFLAAKAFQQPPYTTSAELLQAIRAEVRPDQQGLITDLFEKITFYDNRVVSAQARKRPDGRFEVTVQAQAAKLQADGKGKEHAVPLDDWIEVAIYGAPAGKDALAPVLALQRQHVTSAAPSFTMTVDRLPVEAGFDPDNKLIDRVPADNRRQVTLQ